MNSCVTYETTVSAILLCACVDAFLSLQTSFRGCCVVQCTWILQVLQHAQAVFFINFLLENRFGKLQLRKLKD